MQPLATVRAACIAALVALAPVAAQGAGSGAAAATTAAAAANASPKVSAPRGPVDTRTPASASAPGAADAGTVSPRHASPAPAASAAATSATQDAGTAAPRRARFAWDVPQVIERAPVEGETRAMGVPVKLEAVRSKMQIDALLQYFATEFDRAGLFIPPKAHQPQVTREVQLNALDPSTLTSYTVILQANPDGTTTAFLGEAQLSARTLATGDFPPAMPGAQHAVRTQFESGALLAFTVEAKAPEVLGWYRAALRNLGYQESSPGVFNHSGDQLRVDARGSGREGLTNVFVQSAFGAAGNENGERP